MTSKLDVYLLPAAMLAALLLLRASGAPFEGAQTDGETSGEGADTERPPDALRTLLKSLIGITERHRREFENEFHNTVKYDFLDYYQISSLPEICPHHNFSKEACFRRLVQGLFVYTALLKHVEQEFPDSLVPSETHFYISLLITEIKNRMKRPEEVAALTGGQEEHLPWDVNSTDTFQRKMTAHSILYGLHIFLIRGKRVINKKENLRGGPARMKALNLKR